MHKVKYKSGKVKKKSWFVYVRLTGEDKGIIEPYVGIRHERLRNVSHVNKGK